MNNPQTKRRGYFNIHAFKCVLMSTSALLLGANAQCNGQGENTALKADLSGNTVLQALYCYRIKTTVTFFNTGLPVYSVAWATAI